MKNTYPMTPTQEEAALRRGWIQKAGGWKKPKNFTAADEARIQMAEVRRRRRGIKAD